MRILPAVALLLAASACVPRTTPPEPAPTPQRPARPAASPAPTIAQRRDWRDWAVTPGDWTYRRDSRGSVAAFGKAGQIPLLTLRCDPVGRNIHLSVTGTSATALTVRTTSIARALPVQPNGGTPPSVATTLGANDGLLDAMGFSRGRFAIERPGSTPLVVPAWAEIERVTEDCRG